MSDLRASERVSLDDLREVWPILDNEERVEGFLALDKEEALELFMSRKSLGQATILAGLSLSDRRMWLRILAPDDAADVLQEIPDAEKPGYLALLDDKMRREVSALLAYAEDVAGGLMSPRFGRLRPEMSVDEAITYLRKQVRSQVDMPYYAYILDAEQRLLGVISVRQLFAAPGEKAVHEVMNKDVISVPEHMDQEAVARLIARHDLIALPVVDGEGRMKGIVTVDDIVDVVQEEATEDIQKIGGTQALDAPYLQTRMLDMLKKRGGWLAVLLVGEMLTASAMARYQTAIEGAVVLMLFLPLIISSGGNSGSQASTLVIRAMALGEVKLRDWWTVVRREIAVGLTLGILLAVICLARILAWQAIFESYGQDYMLVAIAVSLSLVGVVAWGTIIGSLLPFVLRRLGFDPASASAPFVATLVDVFGIVIYFQIAQTVVIQPLT